MSIEDKARAEASQTQRGVFIDGNPFSSTSDAWVDGYVEGYLAASRRETSDTEERSIEEKYFETLAKIDPSQEMARVIAQARQDLAKRRDTEGGLMTTDYTALVAELRATHSSAFIESLMSSAANAIEAQAKANTRLRRERNEARVKAKESKRKSEHWSLTAAQAALREQTTMTRASMAEQERDNARAENGDLLNRINELAHERDAAALNVKEEDRD